MNVGVFSFLIDDFQNRLAAAAALLVELSPFSSGCLIAYDHRRTGFLPQCSSLSDATDDIFLYKKGVCVCMCAHTQKKHLTAQASGLEWQRMTSALPHVVWVENRDHDNVTTVSELQTQMHCNSSVFLIPPPAGLVCCNCSLVSAHVPAVGDYRHIFVYGESAYTTS